MKQIKPIAHIGAGYAMKTALKLDIRYKPNLADAKPKIESVTNKNTRAIQNFINHHARGNSHMTVFQEMTKRDNQIVFL